MESEVARTRGLHCNPGLLSHLQPGTEKPKICSVTTLLVDKAQKPVWVPGHRRCEPSPSKCVCWKVYYYISTVLRDFLHKKKGPVFSSPLAANLQENELGVVCINETIKESLESWKLSLLAQSSCQNWLNFRHPPSVAQPKKGKRWVGGGKRCVFDNLCSLIVITFIWQIPIQTQPWNDWEEIGGKTLSNYTKSQKFVSLALREVSNAQINEKKASFLSG